LSTCSVGLCRTLLSGGRRVFLDAAGDDSERPVRKRPLQLQRLIRWRGHPGLDFVRRGQDHRHSLRVDGADLGVRLRRQERVEIVGGFPFDLADRRPVGPDAGEACERPGLVEREPDIAALGLVEFAERVERHQAAVLQTHPPRPVFALHVADVGRCEQFDVESDQRGVPTGPEEARTRSDPMLRKRSTSASLRTPPCQGRTVERFHTQIAGNGVRTVIVKWR
jgi:hypothetical protein